MELVWVHNVWVRIPTMEFIIMQELQREEPLETIVYFLEELLPLWKIGGSHIVPGDAQTCDKGGSSFIKMCKVNCSISMESIHLLYVWYFGIPILLLWSLYHSFGAIQIKLATTGKNVPHLGAAYDLWMMMALGPTPRIPDPTPCFFSCC
jgi:hypothetical protein